MASVKGDGEGLVQGQTAVPGDSLGTATAAPNSHSAPSTKPGPNLDLLSMDMCICCVCCTSSRSYNHQPNAAATPAKLQESPADQITKSMNEHQSQLCHAAASALLCPSACWAATASSTSSSAGRVGVPIPAPPVCDFCSGCSPVWLWCCQPFVHSVPARLFLHPTSNRFCPSAAMRALKASRGRCFCDL